MMYRRFRTPSIWHDMDRMQREMYRMFNSYNPRRFHAAPCYPAVNLWTGDEGLVITTEVPGINPNDMEISVVNDMLTLSGERKSEQVEESIRYHRQERGCGKFTRSIQLPFAVDAGKVEARFTNGVLNVSLPRKEEEKPRKIKVATK